MRHHHLGVAKWWSCKYLYESALIHINEKILYKRWMNHVDDDDISILLCISRMEIWSGYEYGCRTQRLFKIYKTLMNGNFVISNYM